MPTISPGRITPTINIFQNHAVESKKPFDVERLANKFRYRNTDWSIPEAFVGLLIFAAVADGNLDDVERETILMIAKRSRALSTLSDTDLATINNTVIQRMSERPETALREACDTLPAEMTLSVFAHCMDIVLADGQLTQGEGEFIDSLIPLMDIDQDYARRIMEVMLVKAQY